MSKLVLGLDIGITSVGYGVIDIENSEIIDYGVRLFEEGTAEQNKTRRTKRGSRRLKRRNITRRRDLLHLLESANIITSDFVPLGNPYDLRIKGLEEKLNGNELATALLHICKHRGSSLETVEENDDKSVGETKKVLSENEALIKDGYYVCQIQKQRLDETGKIRGKMNNFKTSAYIDEVEKILSNQMMPEELKEGIITIISRKRMYYEGPGGPNSPTQYGRYIEKGQLEPIDLIEKMRGKCSLFPSESRAPKLAYSAELFNVLNDLNNLLIDGEKLTIEQKQSILEVIHEKGKITPKQLAKKLDVDIQEITGFRINTKGDPILTECIGYKLIRDVFKKNQLNELIDQFTIYDEIAEILTKTKGLDERVNKILELSPNIDEATAHELSTQTKFTAYHSLSFKAIYLLNEEMKKTELNQMQIIALSGLNQAEKVSVKGMKTIHADDSAILSPVARRAQIEAFKVINRLREIYGEFDSIVVETTRSKNSKDEKKAIRERQKFFEERNRNAEKLVGENKKINGKLKEKLALYQEQNCKTAYSLEPIDLNLLINDPTAYEVDHIIPISISFDDSITNKVLVTRRENQEKGNLTPFMAFMKGKFSKGTYEQYKANCIALKEVNMKSNKGYRKKVEQYLLLEKDIYKYEVQKEFINRNLVDTSYANKVVFNTLSNYFKQNEIPTKVFTVKGSLTSAMRRKIQLKKDREENYGHHAIDALIVASLPKMKLIHTIFNRYKMEDIYCEETGEVFSAGEDSMYYDDQYFEFIARLKTLKVTKYSHKIDTKLNRSIAKETIYSTRIINGNEIIVEKIKDIYDSKQTKIAEDILNDKYQDKYLMAIHDPETFEEIIRIVKYYFEKLSKNDNYYKIEKNEIKIKDVNPLCEYKKDHGFIRKHSKKGNGPAIIRMKYLSNKLGSHIDISKNYQTKNRKVILKKISPYRTDFYYSQEKGYKFVTIRYRDIKWMEKKHSYVIDQTYYEQLKKDKKIDDTFQFEFSLHHDELIGITKKQGSTLCYADEMWYNYEFNEHDGNTPEILKFTATNSDEDNKIECKPVYRDTSKRVIVSIGKNIVKLQKYSTDSLGNLYKTKKSALKLEFK